MKKYDHIARLKEIEKLTKEIIDSIRPIIPTIKGKIRSNRYTHNCVTEDCSICGIDSLVVTISPPGVSPLHVIRALPWPKPPDIDRALLSFLIGRMVSDIIRHMAKGEENGGED